METVRTGSPAHRDARPPRSVRRAVQAMYGGAIVSVAGIFVNCTTLGDLRQQRPFLSEALRTSTHHQAVAEFIIGGVIVTTLWLFMSMVCRSGLRWARLLGTTLFAVYTVYATEIVAGFDKVDPPGPVQAYTVILWICGVCATVLLWQPAASAHFGARDTRGAD